MVPHALSMTRRSALQILAVGVLVGIFAWAGIALTREAGRVATIWLANGFLVGLLLRTAPKRWPAFVLAGFVGNLAADIGSGDSGAIGISLSLCNVLEVLLAAWPLYRLLAHDLDPLKIAAAAGRFVPWVLAAPILPATLGTTIVTLAEHESFWTVFRLWYAADLLGIVIMTPFVLAMNARVAARLLTGSSRARDAAALLLLIATTFGVFSQNQYPLLFLVLPPLLLVVFRLGLAGAALGLIAMCAIAIGCTIENHGPLSLVQSASIPERVLLLQFYVAVASLMAYPVGVVLTERRRLQRTLAESERRYRTLSEHSSDIIVRVSIDGTREYISPSVTELLGWSPDELLGSARPHFIHPDDRDRFNEEFESFRHGTRTSTLVFRYLHKNGHHVWMESASRVVDGSGPNGQDEIVRVVRDISRRKEIEEALAKSERDLRAVTDNLPVLISFVDADGVVQFCNATHEAWLGRPCSEIVGSHLHDVLGAAAYEQQRQELGRAFLGERVEFELTLKLRDGIRHTRVSYVPRWSPDETITGVYALVTDMTAIKTVEQELVRLARFDVLTGLPNRYQLNERLEQILFRARHAHTPVALLFLDVDKFKLINDSLGHGVGDEVLQQVGSRLQRCVRATDIAARLAGDEFVVVLEGVRTSDEARVVADKILDAMEEPFVVSAGLVPVTVSIGAAFVPNAAMTPSQVLQLADVALYEAKASGRNTCRVASSP